MNRATPIRVRLMLAMFLVGSAGAALAQGGRALPKIPAKTRGIPPYRRDHKPYGVIDKIPDGMTRRRFDISRMPGDTAVSRQTILLSKADPSQQFTTQFATAQDEHPFWTADEKYIFFDSNRSNVPNPPTDPFGTGPVNPANPTMGPFNIFRSLADGSGVTEITDPSDNQSKLDPAVTTDGSLVAYVAGGVVSYNSSLVQSTSGFNLFVLNVAGGSPPLQLTGNNIAFPFSDVRHPTWVPGGNQIAFAARLGAGPYHIYRIDTSTGVITQLTAGTSNDYSPAWSPDGHVIAFTSNAAGFSPFGPVTATGLNANDNIWVITPNTALPDAHKVTGLPGDRGSNRNPSWSTQRPDPLQIVPTDPDPTGTAKDARQLMAFASTRDGVGGARTTSDIYWLVAKVRPDPNANGAYTVTTPETAGNPAMLLPTSTPNEGIDPTEPSAGFDPGHVTNEDFPVWPQYINSYRILFQSNRGNNLNIWGSTIFDVNAPALIKYDIPNNQIIGLYQNSPAPPANSTNYVRQFAPGDTVRFRVRVADYETGVESVWLQIKDPNSSPTSADNKEHKVFVVGPGLLDATIQAVNAPYEIDQQAINPFTNTFRAPGTNGAPLATWPAPNKYMAGVDDTDAFTGYLNPPDSQYWLQLYDDGPISKGGHEPEGEVAGDGVYTNAWTSPINMPSDWYLDVIVRDNAVDPFQPSVRTNWKIYDNVWGMTTDTPFTTRGNLLYVNDYDSGQKWFNTHFGSGFFGSFTFWPTEEWMTEFDPAMIPLQVINGANLTPLFNYLNPLGQLSYVDGLTDDGTSFPPTSRYALWRILSRGPVPDSVLNAYGPHTEQQPPDLIGGGTTPTTQHVAEKAVIWHAPFTGDLFVGPGDLVEGTVQDQLYNFVKNGGRVFLNGQDIAWALTLGQPGAPNQLLNSTFGVQFAGDSASDTPIRPNGTTPGANPIGEQTWFDAPPWHNYPGAIPWDPPANGTLYMGTPISGTPVRDWMGLDVASPDVVRFAPTGDTGGVDFVYQAPSGQPAIMWMGNSQQHNKVVYSPVGFETINPEFVGAGGGTLLLNRRMELMHNIFDYLRTGRIIGIIRSVQSGQPLANVFVRATKGGKTYATTLTLGDGSYSLDGLETIGIYGIDAAKAGFLTLHAQGQLFHGGYQGRADLFLTQATPGSISGTVLRQGDSAPIAGAIVSATSPVDGSVFTGTSGADGSFIIQNVAASDTVGYVVRVSNITPLGYGGSTPPSFGGPEAGAKPAITVGNGQKVSGANFLLQPLPGGISGRVTDKATTNPIGGASVTATASGGGTSFTATTASDGTYTMTNVSPGNYVVVATAPGYAPSAGLAVAVVSKTTTPNANFALSAIPPGILIGRVQTSLGTPISGATVTVTNAAGTVIATATTGNEQSPGGPNYTIPNVPAGSTVNVTASKAGYNNNNPTAPNQVLVASAPPDTTVDVLILDPLHTFEGLGELVSAPYDYATPAAVLLGAQGDVGNGFLFATWATNKYLFYANPPADTFHRGVGYVLTDSNPNTTLALTTPGAAINTSVPFNIQLQPGWNLIGAPFPFPIDFLQLKIIDTNGASEDVISAQSGSNPALGAALWTLDNGFYHVAYTLDQWKGYWLFAYRPVVLVVDPAAGQPRSVPFGAVGRSLEIGNNATDNWKLDLMATAGKAHSTPATLGMTRQATNTYDRFKLASPPAVSSAVVTATFDHQDWGAHNGKYSVDVRSATLGGTSWQFSVTTNVANTPVILTWPNVATVPGKRDLVLTDLDTGAQVNLRNAMSYTVGTMRSTSVRHFRLDVKPAVKEPLALGAVNATLNYSANGRSAASVSITWNQTTDATVRVAILRGGHVLRTVDSGRTRAAGMNDALWDLKTDSGATAASDVYVVEVRAVDSKGHTVRRVTPLVIPR